MSNRRVIDILRSEGSFIRGSQGIGRRVNIKFCARCNLCLIIGGLKANIALFLRGQKRAFARLSSELSVLLRDRSTVQRLVSACDALKDTHVSSRRGLLIAAAVENEKIEDVAPKTEDCSDQHELPIDFGWVQKSLNSF